MIQSIAGFIVLLGFMVAQPLGEYVEVYLPGERRLERVAGTLSAHDAAGATIETQDAGARTLRWDEMTPPSAFALRARLIDRDSASAWMDLGAWGWNLGLETQARAAFAQAVRRNESLAPRVREITATPPPQPERRRPAPERTARQAQRGPVEQAPVIAQPTAADIERAYTNARDRASTIEQSMEIKLREIESDRFRIFTDWNPADDEWVKQTCEDAYRAVAREFRVDVDSNIFVGKLPVYLFERQTDFMTFATSIDEFHVSQFVLGYYVHRTDGAGHLALWKPRTQMFGQSFSMDQARRQWARTLTHEFTHAFVARYKGNGHVPIWLNEGIAEVVSERMFPTPNYFRPVRELVASGYELSRLFEPEPAISGADYPVMMSLVQLLSAERPDAFMRLFEDLKADKPVEAALRTHYNVGFDGLEVAWREYARRLK
jgi:hypothetical protein